MTDKVFKSLVNTVEDNLDSLHKYYELKRDVLGLDILNRYDLALEMAKSNKEYSIPEAQKLVRDSLLPLGEEYLKRFDKIINNRYIDYCQYKGKCSGGYSFATILEDSRILMSYNYNLGSVSTIAHESGHNVHHQFVNENNKEQYRFVSSIVAEVISLTNECLLSSYLAENGNTKEEKLAGIANMLDVIANNLFDAVREGKIEQEMYKEVKNGGMITKEFLDKKSKSSLKKYYGPAVKVDKYSSNSWVTRSHYYMNFYLYSYAICISVASNVARKILAGDNEMLDNYYKFMKLGSDKWPMEAFEVLGVDLESPEVYKGAIEYFDELVLKYREICTQEEVK
jgi:oligoendopeptidase F